MREENQEIKSNKGARESERDARDSDEGSV